MDQDFNLPTPGKITGRKSTITGLFFVSLIPVIKPTDSEIDEALQILGMSRGNCSCAYCGDVKSEWDHFRPTIKNRLPTGYITELCNLVPSCGKCNQSKGNKPWKEWMFSTASKSPKSRGVNGLDIKAERLEAYEKWRNPTRIDFQKALGEQLWSEHTENLERIVRMLEKSEEHAEICRSSVVEFLATQNK